MGAKKAIKPGRPRKGNVVNELSAVRRALLGKACRVGSASGPSGTVARVFRSASVAGALTAEVRIADGSVRNVDVLELWQGARGK